MVEDIANVTELIDRRKLGAFQKRVAFLCAIVAAMEGFNIQSVGFIAPALALNFHLTPANLGLFFSLGLFALLLGPIFVAPLPHPFGSPPPPLPPLPFLR